MSSVASQAMEEDNKHDEAEAESDDGLREPLHA